MLPNVDVPVKFKSDWNSVNPNLEASRLYETSRGADSWRYGDGGTVTMPTDDLAPLSYDESLRNSFLNLQSELHNSLCISRISFGC